MTMPPPNVCRRIRHLHAMMGSANANEAQTAAEKLRALLAEYGCNWNDLPDILSQGGGGTSNAASSQAASQPSTSAPDVNVLDLVLRLIELHVAITAEERRVVALWILHTYIYDQFSITPRLVLLSPVRGCGKTTLLMLLELLAHEPHRTDGVTPAAIYHHLSRRPHTTWLVDEGDNLGLLNNPGLRQVFNGGHQRGGGIDRFVGGWSTKFSTFARLAVTAIGTLPLPLLHRCAAVINMQRYAPAPGEPVTIEELDEDDPRFSAARDQIKRWAATCSLARKPETPFENPRSRAADNWRVLLAIADDLGHGEEARAAAVKLCGNRPDEDPGVTLLADILIVFLAQGIDRITSTALVEALLGLADGEWNEWRGPHDDRPPHKLTQAELAQMLRPFHIRSRTVWPARRRPTDKSSRGYYKNQFEDAWRSYCSSAGTTSQANKIRYLRGGIRP